MAATAHRPPLVEPGHDLPQVPHSRLVQCLRRAGTLLGREGALLGGLQPVSVAADRVSTAANRVCRLSANAFQSADTTCRACASASATAASACRSPARWPSRCPTTTPTQASTGDAIAPMSALISAADKTFYPPVRAEPSCSHVLSHWQWRVNVHQLPPAGWRPTSATVTACTADSPHSGTPPAGEPVGNLHRLA
ncbi:hypothetical protein I552_10239 [Mycobacterium xenopi 3993]|nr:hypothetical protein I552_10239 [Mycobacterium xenopi 3993]